MRILGLDLGEKRVGVSISDEIGFSAQPLSTIHVNEQEAFFTQIKELVDDYGVVKIVVGLPLNMDGTLGTQGRQVMKIVKNLKNKVNIPIRTWDERLSTVAVTKNLIGANVSRKKRKKIVDKLSAVFILQGYLDYLSHRKKKNGNF
ncbi:MAG: Holliday junction resolvase RuvX [Thermodesulfobacteriota bacterium]|nr:Holliday junction resolvase RuvX [Thermodesulfobacteriota bacterium]